MEINSIFQKLSVKEDDDQFFPSYMQNDANRKFYGVSHETVHIRPADMLREIQLGDGQWVKIVKLGEPIGMSVKEFEFEFEMAKKFEYEREYQREQCRYQRTGQSEDLLVQDFSAILFDAKKSKTILQRYSNTWMGGLPMLFKRLLTYCHTLNPKLARCQLRWCRSTSLKTNNCFDFSDLSWNTDPCNERYLMSFGPVKSKLILQDVNLNFDHNGNRISGPEYHVQFEHNTLVVMSRKLKFLQYTIDPGESGETVPLWLEFSNNYK